MKFFFFAALFLQAAIHPVAAQSVIEGNNFDKTIRIYDANGKPMINGAIDAVGSPFFLPNWKLGSIRLINNMFFPSVPLKLDLEQQEVHYRRGDGTDVDVQPGQIRQITVTDTIAGAPVTYQFLSGFPPIDNQTETSF